MKRIVGAMERELALAEASETARDLGAAWVHLERAHILSQPFAWPHLRVHGRMLRLALRRGAWREVAGQLPRLVLAGPGSWTGRAPRGNTGGADVGIFTPMPIPADLAEILGRPRAR